MEFAASLPLWTLGGTVAGGSIFLVKVKSPLPVAGLAATSMYDGRWVVPQAASPFAAAPGGAVGCGDVSPAHRLGILAGSITEAV